MPWIQLTTCNGAATSLRFSTSLLFFFKNASFKIPTQAELRNHIVEEVNLMNPLQTELPELTDGELNGFGLGKKDKLNILENNSASNHQIVLVPQSTR